MARYDDDDDDRPRPARRRPRDDDDDDDMRPMRRQPQKSKLPLILGIVGGVLLLCCGSGAFGVYYMTRKAGEKLQEVADKIQDGAAEAESRNNMRRIAMGLHNENDMVGRMQSNTYKNGRPYLSWRVHVLPYIDESNLYRRFKLDEPWDSPNNKPLSTQMPAVFSTLTHRRKHGDNLTPYRAMTSPRGGLGHSLPKHDPQLMADGPNFARFPDGLSNTILIFESDEFVEWTRPDEVEWNDANAPKPFAIPSAGAGKPTHFNVIMGDAGPRRIKRSMDNQTLWRLFTRDDGMVLPAGWED